MTDFDLISNAEITSGAADVDSLTFVKYKNRDAYSKEVMDGTHDDKIPGQSLEVVASGSGDGVRLTSMNYLRSDSATSGVHNVAANGVSYITTTIPGSTVRAWKFTVVPNEATGTAVYTFQPANRPNVTPNLEIQVSRTGDNATAHTLGWVAVAVAVS